MIIEEVVRNHLLEKLDVPVYLSIPSNPPDTFVSVERVGGGSTNGLKSGKFALQSWGKTIYDAATLNETVKEAMETLVEVKEVSGAYLNSDYDWTDTETKHCRYQAVYDIYHYC